jgi:hypothetical protein
MSYLSIDIRCDKCDLVAATLVERSERDSSWECPDCAGTMTRTISAPNITRKSFVDGTKRKGFADMKEAVRVEREMMDLPHDKREGHHRAIRELKKI